MGLKIPRCALWGPLTALLLCAALTGPAFAQSHPQLAHAARQAYLAGDLAYARTLSEAMLHSAQAAPERALAYGALDQIDHQRPFEAWVFGALLPSTNITAAPRGRWLETQLGRFEITEGSARASGLGYRFGIHLQGRAVLGPGLRLRPALRVTRIAYPRHSAQNQWIIAPSVQIEKLWPGFALSASLAARQYHFASGSTRHDLEWAMSARRIASARRAYQARFSVTQMDYSAHDHRDGLRYDAALQMQHSLGPKTRLTMALGLTRTDLNAAHLSFDAAHVSARMDRRIGRQDLLGVELEFATRLHDAPMPLIGHRRHDHRTTATLSWGTQRINVFGAPPQLSCSVSATRSTIALYDTGSVNCSLALTRRF